MTKSESTQITKVFRSLVDHDRQAAEQGVIDLIAGRYRTKRAQLAECDEDNGQVLGAARWAELKATIDMEPLPERKPVGRPKKDANGDLPGQGDLYAEPAIDPDLNLDLTILRHLRGSAYALVCEEIAEDCAVEPSDVAVRLAALEQEGRIRKSGRAWEVVPDEAPAPMSDEPTEAKPWPENEEQRWEAYRRHAREALVKGPAPEAAWRKAFGFATGLKAERMTEVLDDLISSGVLVRDGKKLAMGPMTEADLVAVGGDDDSDRPF